MKGLFVPSHVKAARQLMKQEMVTDPTTGRQMLVFMPPEEHAESRAHHEELVQRGREETLAELKAQGPKPTRKVSVQDAGKLLNDFKQYLARNKNRTTPNRYTRGF